MTHDPIPNTLEAAEVELVSVLKAAFPTLEVAACPDDVANYRFTHRVGAILVHYRSSHFEPPKTMGTVVQDRLMEWGVHILARNLRAHAGAYPHLDAVRACLTGHRLAAASGPLHPVSEGAAEEDRGVWHYVLVFRAAAVWVQQDTPDQLPLLNRIRVLDAAGNEEAEITGQGITIR
jgi:hypothetical protein